MSDYGGNIERKKLRFASFEFNYACIKKLEAKQKQGYYGWDNPINKENLESLFKEHTNRPLTQRNLVDISNFCNFLWNLLEAQKE